MTRRVALACSFALTVVVSFAVVTLGSSAGWFGGETEASTAAAPSQESQPGLSPTPQVVVVDIPVVTAPAQTKQQSAVAPQQPTTRQPVYRDDDNDDRHGDDDRYDDRDDDDDRHGDDDRYDDHHGDDNDDDGGHDGRGRDHPEDD